jgi:hypothetical protein
VVVLRYLVAMILMFKPMILMFALLPPFPAGRYLYSICKVASGEIAAVNHLQPIAIDVADLHDYAATIQHPTSGFVVCSLLYHSFRI